MNSPLAVNAPTINSPARRTIARPVANLSIDYKATLRDVLIPIEKELYLVEKLICDGLRVEEPNAQRHLDYVKELGGKRLRPCLTLLSAKACGTLTEETIRLAAAVELVHTATLVHDDIIDKATSRRHKPTLHSVCGNSQSVLTGDWLFTHAYGLANEGTSTLPGRWIANAAKRVCEGEIKQAAVEGKFDLTIQEHLQVLAGKTGALCRVSCMLGAWSAGADSTMIERFGRFGELLGVAFQVHDDWLDVWGSEASTGKTLGTDLMEFKPTLPALFAVAEGFCDEQRPEVLERLREKDFSILSSIREAMDFTQASLRTREVARNTADRAIESLEELEESAAICCSTTALLKRLALAATHRAA